jgi:hypothetical protein
MKTFCKTCVLIWLFLLSNTLSYGQIEKFKALFVFNIIKYVEWPPSLKSGDFVIGIYGDDEITPHLEAIAQKKKIGAQTITVYRFNTVNDIKPCHLLYVPSSKAKEFAAILEKFISSNTLIVTDKTGLIKQGAAISFYDDGGELKFEISKTNIEKAGLIANSNLFVMGKSVQ